MTPQFRIFDAMSLAASTESDIFDIGHASKLWIQVMWPATGTPVGIFGIRAGAFGGRLVDLGSLSGTNFTSAGTQPSGTAGFIAVEFDPSWRHFQIYYTRTSGTGTATADASAKL